jgi:hypothetical protein
MRFGVIRINLKVPAPARSAARRGAMLEDAAAADTRQPDAGLVLALHCCRSRAGVLTADAAGSFTDTRDSGTGKAPACASRATVSPASRARIVS